MSFYDRGLRPISIGGHTVSATGEAKGIKVTLDFVAKNGALVSQQPLPKGEDYLVVVQVRENASARPKNYRLRFQTEICAECKRAEYAGTCEDGGEHADGADKKMKSPDGSTCRRASV